MPVVSRRQLILSPWVSGCWSFSWEVQTSGPVAVTCHTGLAWVTLSSRKRLHSQSGGDRQSLSSMESLHELLKLAVCKGIRWFAFKMGN